jgi:excisionase family DNA binding protein
MQNIRNMKEAVMNSEDEVLPRIWTLSDVAEYLKVGEEVIRGEINAGRLNGFKVGNEWRCTQLDVQAYITKPRGRIGDQPHHALGRKEDSWTLEEIGSFDFRWPKEGGSSVEHYETGYSAAKAVDGQQIALKLGFSDRKAAGQMRKRVTIWLGNRPLVEFAGSNDYDKDGILASVIRLKNNKQMTYQRIPAEYEGFRVERYNSVVNGPRASTAFAVVVHKDDLTSMLDHALIRARWKGLL